MLELSEPHILGDAQEIEALIRSLAATEAALAAALPDEVDAVINPTTATPILLHRAQVALQTSEGRYRNLLSRMAAIVFELEPDGTILYVNDAVGSATGYPAQDLLGMNWWNTFFPGEQYTQVTTLLARLQQDDVANFELSLTTRNGSSIVLEVNTANHYMPDGKLQKFLGLGVDITERKREERGRRFLVEASAALSASLDYQATLTNLAQLAVPTLADWCIVHIIDKNETIQEVAITHRDMNKAAWASKVARDYPPEPNTGSHVWSVLESGKANLYPEITDAMLVSRARDARHLAFLREMGFASLMIVPLLARGRTFGAIQFVLSDAGRRFDEFDLALAEEMARRAAISIDNSRLYEEAREQRERLQITLTSIGDAVIAADDKGHVSFMNPVAQLLTGWTQAEAQGLPLQEVFPIVDEASREPVENPFVKVMRGGATVGLSNPTILVARDGTDVHIDNSGAPIRDETGAIVGVILVFHDITEQRQAQIALRDSEQRFKAIFDQAAVGMTQSTLEGRWVLANQSFCKMLGYTQEELLDHTFAEFTHPHDLPAQLEHVRQIVAGELQSFSMEKRHIRKDGSTFWVNVTSSPVHSATDTLDSYMSVVEDITERKRADEQVRFQAHLLDTVGQSVIATDLEDKVIYWNRFAEELYGWTAAEAMGHYVVELIVSFRTPEQRAEMIVRLKNGEGWTGEFEIQRRDGTPFPALVTNTPIYDVNETLVGIIRVSTDISERKRAEQALLDERNILRTLIDNLPDYIFTKDIEGRFMVSNAAHAHAVQLEPTMLVGKTAAELFGPELAPDYDADDRLVLRTGQALINVERTTRDALGNRQSVLTTKVPLRDQTGQIVGLVGISRDVTERKHAEEALRVSEEAEREQRVLAEALLDSSATLTSVLDLSVVMNRILENVGRVISHDSANIMLIDGDKAYVAYWRSYPLELADSFKTERIPLVSPSLSQMLETRLPLVIDDVTAYPGWVSGPKNSWIRSYAAAPIQAHGQIIGFLNIDSAEPRQFSGLDTKALEAFANQAAIAIENAQLYDELHRHATELESRVDLRTAELHQATEHLESIFNSSTDAIVVVGRDGLIEQKNPSFSRLFGEHSDAALGRPIMALAASGSVDALTKAFSVVMAKATSRQIELVVQHRDGTQFDADMILSPIVGPGQQTTEVICNVRDITQRKQMETGLRKTLEKERELGELKSRFLSMASHDFRTPLAVILSSASLLQLYNDKMAAELRLKHLNKIHVGVHQMTELLDDLLTFTQEDEGRLEYKPVPLDLEALCREMLEETQIASDKTHEFVFSSTGNCLDAVIDKKLLRQIVNNLLSNAAKYSPEGSVVNFDLSCKPGQAILRVQDHGIGIPEKDQSRIFEPFHRAGNVNAVRGTGLGLAIVKRAAELHGGGIKFESHVGIGTTFTVVISTSQEAQ